MLARRVPGSTVPHCGYVPFGGERFYVLLHVRRFERGYVGVVKLQRDYRSLVSLPVVQCGIE
jgi:hypothetical protein